ncbi:unnamed protein product [Ilex paraguariensis]|uniref:Uncharacterized protein n=1 Tax=Ilex paraguariensis TaxID=185542 RepID=A0ABC8SMV8_9AQUA
MADSRVQVNMSHKTRFASKSSRNVHKVPLKDKSKIAKSEHNVAKGARAARIQRNKMMREQKRAALLKEKRASSGSTSPPRVIVSISLRSVSVYDNEVLFGLSALVNLNALEEDLLALLSEVGTGIVFPAVASSEYKLRTTLGFISLYLSCTFHLKIYFIGSKLWMIEGCEGLEVLKAPHGDLLACMEMAKDLPIDLKRRHDLKKTCTSILASEFPQDSKFYAADTKDELHKFMWLFKEHRLTVPHQHNQRAYLMAQRVDFVPNDCNSETCTLVLTGYLCARNLAVDQLVHVSGAGDFQMCKIELLKDPCPLNARKGDFMDSDEVHDVQVITALNPDPLKQEPLLIENVPDPLAGDQTWPTEAEMAEADRIHKEKKLKKRTLPCGTSEYQAAWIVDDSDMDDSYGDDDADDVGMVLDSRESGNPGQEGNFELDLVDDQASLILNRESDEETEVESVMMEGDKMTKEQIEDEIRKIKDEHAKDEGASLFRWLIFVLLEPLAESLPLEYARIFAFDNFARTQKHVLAKALEMEQGSMDECIPAGSYARIHIKEFPHAVVSKLCELAKTMPVTTCGLLQHESQGFCPSLQLPQRVSKLKASVKYMFHNPEDVKWFKPVEIWTKCRRRGRIKEPVGTHGMLLISLQTE